MTSHSENIKKLQKAKDLIREVEFSFPLNHPVRSRIYRWLVRGDLSINELISTVSKLEKEALQNEGKQ